MRDTSSATRRRLLAAVGIATAGGLAGCTQPSDSTETPTETGMGTGTDDSMGTPTETDAGTDTTTEGDTAMLRAAHMSPNAPNVDVYVGGSAVLEDVPFGAVSDYLEVPAGGRQVELTAAGDPDTSVFEGTVMVEAGTAATVAAIGELGDEADQPFEPLVLADDRSAPADDMARVRLVHASPDAPAVDVTVAASGDAIFDGVGYGESGTVEVPAGDYTLQVRGDTGGNDGEVAAEFDVTVEGGQAYTAFAGGYLSPDDEPAATAFDLFVAKDTPGMN